MRQFIQSYRTGVLRVADVPAPGEDLGLCFSGLAVA